MATDRRSLVIVEMTENGPLLILKEDKRDKLMVLLAEELAEAATQDRFNSRAHAAPEATPFYRDVATTMLYQLLQYGALSPWEFHRGLLRLTENRYDRAHYEAAVKHFLSLVGIKS